MNNRDFDAAVSHLKQSGAPFRLEPIGTPVCRMAVVSDPDGNSIISPRSFGPENAQTPNRLLPTEPTCDNGSHAGKGGLRPKTRGLWPDLAPTPGVFFMLRLPLRISFGR
jgi:hypothetical protein